jgi:hypothetical protein
LEFAELGRPQLEASISVRLKKHHLTKTERQHFKLVQETRHGQHLLPVGEGQISNLSHAACLRRR